jgi:hypothetical protein
LFISVAEPVPTLNVNCGNHNIIGRMVLGRFKTLPNNESGMQELLKKR